MSKKKKHNKVKEVLEKYDDSAEKQEAAYKEQLRLLEERKRTLDVNKQAASQGKGFFKRLAIGFKSNVQQASLNAEINDTRGYLRAKRQAALFKEQAAMLEQKKKVQALKAETAVDYNKIMGLGGNPKAVNFKPISMEDIYR